MNRRDAREHVAHGCSYDSNSMAPAQRVGGAAPRCPDRTPRWTGVLRSALGGSGCQRRRTVPSKTIARVGADRESRQYNLFHPPFPLFPPLSPRPRQQPPCCAQHASTKCASGSGWGQHQWRGKAHGRCERPVATRGRAPTGATVVFEAADELCGLRFQRWPDRFSARYEVGDCPISRAAARRRPRGRLELARRTCRRAPRAEALSASATQSAAPIETDGSAHRR